MSEASLEWSVVQRAAMDRLHQLLQRIETISPDQLQRIQGEIASLRWLLGLPEQMLNSVLLSHIEAETIHAGRHNPAGAI